MFSRYGVNSLVQFKKARAAMLRRPFETGGTPSASSEIGMFLRLGGVIAVVAAILAVATSTMH